MATLKPCLPPFRLCFLKEEAVEEEEEEEEKADSPLLSSIGSGSAETLSTAVCENDCDFDYFSDMYLEEIENFDLELEVGQPSAAQEELFKLDSIFDDDNGTNSMDSSSEGGITSGMDDEDVISIDMDDNVMEEEEEEVEDDEDEESFLLPNLNTVIDRFAVTERLPSDAVHRLKSDFNNESAHTVLMYNAADVWKVNCEYGFELQNFVRETMSLRPGDFRRGACKERGSIARRKVCIHHFCLDLLCHTRYSRVVQWIDRKSLTFRVLNTNEIARLWKLVKGNSKQDYETFGRGVRFSMVRGFFAKVRPQKKKVYKLTEKAVKSYRDYRPNCKVVMSKSIS